MPSRTPGLSRRIEYDTDTLDAADMYLAYVLPRAARREPKIGSGSAQGRPMRRLLHHSAIFRSWQLLNIQRYHGYAWLRDTWRNRLELAGIDPESMQIVEPRRWARAWQRLSTTWRFRKADAIQGNTLDWDAPWPPEPVIRGLRKCPRAPKKELKPPPEAAKKFDLTTRFRRKIVWSPDEEQKAEPETIASLEYNQPGQLSMPIPGDDDEYGMSNGVWGILDKSV